MVATVIGRDTELASVGEFIERPSDGPALLLLDGEAGIGKSTLWLTGVEAAQARGFRVLSARPAEAEQTLAYATLGDLLEDVLGDVLGALKAPRRRALETALLLVGAGPDGVDARAVALGTRDVLEVLGEETPVLVAIDDLQWLDGSSARALSFALRRVATNRILVLAARRLGTGAPESGLEGALGPERVRRVGVAPLSAGALHKLLLDRLGRPFARQTLLRIHERSGGNPFFALELGRALPTDPDPLEPLPVPETLDELLRARMSALPAPAREALELASAVGTTPESLLARAGVAAGALEPAAAAQLIERDGGRIRFTHPLLPAVLYRDLGAKRRRVHERLAGVVEDPLLRARHLALSRDTPDAEAARALEHAAGLAADRGASAAAAELAEQALRLTPPAAAEERHRRTLAAARAHHAAGEWTRARSLTAALLSDAEIGPLRAEALILLAELEAPDRAVSLLEEALREAASRPSLLSVVHCRLAWAARFQGGLGHARAALALAEQEDDPVLRARARAVEAVLAWFAGTPAARHELTRQGHDFANAIGGDQLVQEATLAIANTLAPAARRGEARAFFEREHREWRERDEPRSARALWGLSWVELWAGRWPRAAALAAEAHDISIQYGIEVPQDHLPIALVALHRGELELARRHSERALRLAREQFADHEPPPQHLAILGLVALWGGEWPAAGEWLRRAEDRASELGWREPSVRWWTSDYAELLLERGEIERAAELLAVWERDAVRVGREWVLAHAIRCSGLVAAADGDVGRAASLLEQAVAEHERLGDPYGRARALLALGIVRRRARRKRTARDAVQAALDGFEQLGAATWVERARSEIGTIGGRAPSVGLTPAERRVAVLVAEGRTNREVAAALFLGERTVASHLTHIYAKLRVRSRTELARKLRVDGTADAGKVQTF